MGLSLIIVGILSFVADKTDGGLVLGWIIIGFIFVFEIVFSLSIGPVAWVYNADILSSKVQLYIVFYIKIKEKLLIKYS